MFAMFAALFASTSSAELVQKGPFNFSVSEGANNHTYAFYIAPPGNYENDGVSWEVARANASALVLDGRQGYLATITTLPEQIFIMEQLQAEYLYPNSTCEHLINCTGVYGNVTCSNETGFDLWIGLRNEYHNGTWTWITEPNASRFLRLNTTDFHFFAAGEPNNFGNGGENCTQVKLGNTKYNNGCVGPLWNDQNCDSLSGWIVEWDPITTAPTTTPTTIAPTTSIPTTPPTTSVPTAMKCVSCEISLCSSLKFHFEPPTCDKITRLGQIGSSWMASPLQTRAAQNTICCFLEHFANNSTSCHDTFDKTLFVDMCNQLQADLAPQRQADFQTDGWCSRPLRNLSEIVTCPPLTSVVYNVPPNTSMPAVGVEHGLPCVELSQKRFVATQSTFVELGPLAAVQANASQYPDIPPIERVESSDRTTAVLYNTACLQTTVVNLGWLIWLICFFVVAAACTWFSWKRRLHLPVRARTPILLYGSVLWIVVNFTWVAIDQITGMTAPCGLISFGNLVAFPMLLTTYLTRSLRLLFLYLSSVRKLSHKRDWFFNHRQWLAPRSAATVLGVALVCFLIIFIVANVVDGTFTDTYLGSGRCKWWDINQAVATAAGTYGVDLGPTNYNQNGFVPYSPEYSSCVFCTSSGTNAFMAVLTALLLLLLLTSLLAMSRLRDQYLLRLELFGVLCLFTLMAALRIVMFFPSSAQLVMDRLGLDISLLLLSLALFLSLLITAFFPAAMSFSRRFREQGEGRVRDSVVRKSEPTFEEMLLDPVGFGLFVQFETESFQVENISFHQAMQELKALDMSDPERVLQIEKIYTTYIEANSLMEVNIDYHLRKKYESEESRRGPDVFEDILAVIAGLLHVNSWIRFRKSPLWKAYLKDIAERQREDGMILSQMESTRIANTDE